jgi:hypothetical protein
MCISDCTPRGPHLFFPSCAAGRGQRVPHRAAELRHPTALGAALAPLTASAGERVGACVAQAAVAAVSGDWLGATVAATAVAAATGAAVAAVSWRTVQCNRPSYGPTRQLSAPPAWATSSCVAGVLRQLLVTRPALLGFPSAGSVCRRHSTPSCLLCPACFSRPGEERACARG